MCIPPFLPWSARDKVKSFCVDQLKGHMTCDRAIMSFSKETFNLPRQWTHLIKLENDLGVTFLKF